MLKRLIVGMIAAFLVMGAARAQDPMLEGIAAYQRGDYEASAQWFRKAADQGIAAAQYNLGNMYAKGQGVPQDYALAVEWWRRAADQGLAAAQFNLGLMYYRGDGVPQDHAQAAQWFRKAADQGNADAQFNLGLMYYRGEGVPQDHVAAHMWFNLAASRGQPNAGSNRDTAASKMTREQIAEAQRLAREWRPKSSQ
jgi:TPR repeat protein